MFAKVFYQIFESSISEDHVARHVFMDMLVLADEEGVIDKTPEAIARITNVPLEIVKRAIFLLCQPDERSRTRDEDGRRLCLIDDHRDWGWRIVNYLKYRGIRDQEARRISNRSYKRDQRAKEKAAEIEAKIQEESAIGQHLSARVLDSQAMSAQVEGEVEVEEEVKKKRPARVKRESKAHPLFEDVKQMIFKYYNGKNRRDPEWNGMEGNNLASLLSSNAGAPLSHWRSCLVGRYHSAVNHSERPGLWITKLSSYSNPVDAYNRPKENGNGNSKSERAQRNIEDAIRLAGHFEGTGNNGDLPGSGSTTSGVTADPSEEIGTRRLIEGNSRS